MKCLSTRCSVDFAAAAIYVFLRMAFAAATAHCSVRILHDAFARRGTKRRELVSVRPTYKSLTHSITRLVSIAVPSHHKGHFHRSTPHRRERVRLQGRLRRPLLSTKSSRCTMRGARRNLRRHSYPRAWRWQNRYRRLLVALALIGGARWSARAVPADGVDGEERRRF